jgi:tryptophan-rich sensory protein
MSPATSRDWFSLIGFLAAAFTAWAIGGLATASSVGTWFTTLAKPSWNPPGYLFGPVWTALYLMMAIAAWRVWRLRTMPALRTAVRAVLIAFFLQLILNAAWSLLFFGLRRPDLAFLDIVALLAALFWIQIRLTRLDRVAAALWLPYLLWVSFATALNFTIWRLNA